MVFARERRKGRKRKGHRGSLLKQLTDLTYVYDNLLHFLFVSSLLEVSLVCMVWQGNPWAAENCDDSLECP